MGAVQENTKATDDTTGSNGSGVGGKGRDLTGNR